MLRSGRQWDQNALPFGSLGGRCGERFRYALEFLLFNFRELICGSFAWFGAVFDFKPDFVDTLTQVVEGEFQLQRYTV